MLKICQNYVEILQNISETLYQNASKYHKMDKKFQEILKKTSKSNLKLENLTLQKHFSIKKSMKILFKFLDAIKKAVSFFSGVLWSLLTPRGIFCV